ncbi:Digeranylgeranylglycerophospholipid reductase [uncultured Gammaproteobacteria bacterium]|nr:Digeranylgeranylglycerophospholipid reductase [uncultured Gammaproteobacteria bacterium]
MNIVKKIPFPAVLAIIKIKMKNIFIFIILFAIIPPAGQTVSENYLDLFAKQDKSQEINSQSHIANAKDVIYKMLTNEMLANFVETDPDANDLVVVPLKLQCSTLKALTSFVETDLDTNDLVMVPLKLQCSTLKALTSFVETDPDTNDLVVVPLKLQRGVTIIRSDPINQIV